MKIGLKKLLALSLLVLTGSALALLANQRQRDISDSELRLLQREHQQLQRTLNQLQAPDAVAKLNVIEKGMDAVRLSFVESLGAINDLPEVLALRYVIGRSQDRSPDPDYLRIAIHLDLPHADSLLAVIKHLDTAASVWPHLLRGCSMHRNEGPEGLAVTCFYDVYVWDALL